jgi:regulator of sirC expression with transglutaminase-like and TPR domain
VHEVLQDSAAQAEKIRRRFDFMFHEFKSTVGTVSDPLESISALNEFLFVSKKFMACDDAGSGPDELLMGRVLESRRGSSIPIAVIYREMAQRAGLPAIEFVNFPGHSFVKMLYRHQLMFFDPAENGRLLSVADLQEKLSGKYGKDVFLNASFLETPNDLHVISRLLAKLKNVYFDARDWPKLLAVLDMIIAMSPARKAEYKERGLLLYQIGLKEEAKFDLEFFVSSSRPSEETERIHRVLQHLNNPAVTPLF